MSTIAATLEDSFLERRFRFREQGTTLARDTMAGLTTFAVMSYIIAVNPAILSSVKDHTGHGLPFAAVLTGTCLVAGVMSIIMGLYTNRAFALAPGMGLNAVVTYGLVAKAGATWPEAMGIVVLEGAAIVALVLSGYRQRIFRAIPVELKKAIAIGIGLFITFIGLYNSGIIVQDPSHATPVGLGSFTTWPVFVTLFGLVFTLVLRAQQDSDNAVLRKLGQGALLIGIVVTTVLATLINASTSYKSFTTPGAAHWPGQWHQTPDFSLIGHISFSSFGTLGVVSTLVWAASLALSDFFDMSGTFIGVGKAAGYVDKNGEMKDLQKPLLVDALAAAAGGGSSVSSATTYIENGSGVAAGGRTGWVAVVAGLLFFPFMFLAPIIEMVPAQATAASLVIVGVLMISTLTEAEDEAEGRTGGRKLAGIDFHNMAIGTAATLTIFLMPATYTITDGIGWGFIAYTLICAARREWRRIHPFMWIVSAAFVLYFLVPLLQQQVSWI